MKEAMSPDDHCNLVELEQRAFQFKRDGNAADAAYLYSELLRRVPSWEHGYGAYALAECLETLGRIDEAKTNYVRALSHNSEDRIFLGGYASFLYLHGEPNEALEWHIKLLTTEWRSGDLNGCEITKLAIRLLGQRTQLSNATIESAIANATTTAK